MSNDVIAIDTGRGLVEGDIGALQGIPREPGEGRSATAEHHRHCLGSSRSASVRTTPAEQRTARIMGAWFLGTFIAIPAMATTSTWSRQAWSPSADEGVVLAGAERPGRGPTGPGRRPGPFRRRPRGGAAEVFEAAVDPFGGSVAGAGPLSVPAMTLNLFDRRDVWYCQDC